MKSPSFSSDASGKVRCGLPASAVRSAGCSSSGESSESKHFEFRNPNLGFRSDERCGMVRSLNIEGSEPGGTSLTMLNTLFWLRNQTRTSNSINLVLSFKFSKFNYVMTHQLKIRFGLRSSEQLLVGEAGRRSEFERSLRGRI